MSTLSIELKAKRSRADKDDRSVMGLLYDLSSGHPGGVSVMTLSDGEITEHIASDLFSDVVAVGSVLTSMSLMTKNVAVIGDNSYNWLVAYLAVVCSGAAALVIDPALSAQNICEQLSIAGTELVMCDSDKYCKLSDGDKSYQGSVVMLDEHKSYTVPNNIDSFIKLGNSLIENGYTEFKELSRNYGDAAHIVFDSGVYGMEKAVTISGRGLYTQIENAAEAVYAGKKVLVTGHMSNTGMLEAAVLAPMFMGSCVCICSDDISVYEAARRFEADMIIAFPSDVRRLYAELWSFVREAGISDNLAKKIRTGALLRRVGISVRRHIRRYMKSKKIYCPGNIICFGNNIDEETSYGVHMMGISLRCAYCVPECGMISVTRRSDGKNQTLGRTFPGVYVRVDNTGRILVRSDATMSGYFGEGTYPDYWIATGDIGELVADGQVVLENDPSELYITEDGKRIFPSRLNEFVKRRIPYAKSIAVDIEDDGVVLFVSFDEDFVKLSGKQGVKSIVASSVEEINKMLCEHEQIKNTIVENIV